MSMNTVIADTAKRSGPYRIVGVAVVLMAALVVGAMFVANAANRPQPSGGLPVGATTPIASSASSPEASPSTSLTSNPTPVASTVASTFTCGSSTAFTKQSYGLIDAVRIGMHTGYDRVTIEFQGGQAASIKLQPQAGTAFTRDGIGDTVHLAGTDGLLVSMFSTDSHTAYNGPTDIKTSFAGLLEVRLVGDYEGYVHWALGLSKPACYHAVILNNPTRLVIDVQRS